MDSRALGLLETFGLIPAIEGADAAVKTAEVELTGLERIGAGLVTVKFRGDVSAVNAAMESARTAAARLGEVRFHTVIARTGEGLSQILDGPAPEPAARPVQNKPAPAPAVQKKAAEPLEEAQPPAPPAEEELAGMKVTQLRQLARSLKGFPLSRKKIKFARKEELIAKITEYRSKQ
ncbi:MAG: BMC domain-containing protein [Desulfobacter sp.]|nr:MAG: BMC domain-containing protein [Desulfobacter sp.]